MPVPLCWVIILTVEPLFSWTCFVQSNYTSDCWPFCNWLGLGCVAICSAVLAKLPSHLFQAFLLLPPWARIMYLVCSLLSRVDDARIDGFCLQIFIFGPLSLIVALYYLFESHGWAWIFLQLLHIVIQVTILILPGPGFNCLLSPLLPCLRSSTYS